MARKKTGEKEIFRKVYEKQKGILFDTEFFIHIEKVTAQNFMHILSKGSHPAYRLNIENIVMVSDMFHFLYDNGSREELEKRFNKFKVGEIYERKQKLKTEYYKKFNK